MVNVGIIGLGPAWETRYLPALKKLRGRIRVCAVYDAVANRSQHVAKELQCRSEQGIVALAERTDIRGLLILDSTWHGHALLQLVCSLRKPALIADCRGSDRESLKAVYKAAVDEGTTLMPEFGERYTPATGRLKELIATRMGNPRRIVVNATVDSDEARDVAAGDTRASHELVNWLDWCRYVIGSAPTAVSSGPFENEAGDRGRRISVEFHSSASDHPTAELRILDTVRSKDRSGPASVTTRLEVVCERGSAIVESPIEIAWKTETKLVTESLASERSNVEVMLDHFCRRVAGGLIPVADLNDVCRSLTLVEAAQRSFVTGQPVSLNGQA